MVPTGPHFMGTYGPYGRSLSPEKKSIWVVPVGKSERAARPRPFQQGLVAYGNWSGASGRLEAG